MINRQTQSTEEYELFESKAISFTVVAVFQGPFPKYSGVSFIGDFLTGEIVDPF